MPRGSASTRSRSPSGLSAATIGWFHLSREETARARDFLRRCNGEDAVDELGFGIIRDGFSDQFYPGTSTVMTQPRYLIFIPAIYRHIERMLEKKKGAIQDIARQSRLLQDELRDVLATTYDYKRGEGVIGISKKELERYPSSIYWASLRTLGILRRRGIVESDYLRALERHRDDTRSDANSGDPVAEVAAPAPAWDRHFPYVEQGEPILSGNGSFRPELDFTLNAVEAAYLSDCYLRPLSQEQRSEGLERSLLASLIARRRRTTFSYPWDVKAPPHLEQAVEDARHFSLLARGATLQYYYWLLEARRQHGWEVPKADIEVWFDEWWEGGRPELREWDVELFLQRRSSDIRPARKDALFLKDWLRSCSVAKNAASFLRDTAVKQLITERERTVKPRKARLTHAKHLETWNRSLPASSRIHQLDFRTSIGRVFVLRIVEGLGDDYVIPPGIE